MRHEWPGNVRELENAVERALVVGRGGEIRPNDFSFQFQAGDEVKGGRTLEDIERVHIERFTLNPSTLELTRDIVAEDPSYFADKYVDKDSVLPADAPFKVEPCKELAPEYQQTVKK